MNAPSLPGRRWRIQWRMRSGTARREAFIDCVKAGPDEGRAAPKLRAWLAMGLWGKESAGEREAWLKHQLRPAVSIGMDHGLDGDMLAAVLAAGLPVNERDPERWFDTLLSAAVRAQATSLFVPLIQAGADPELVDGAGHTPIELALWPIFETTGQEWGAAWAQLEALVQAGASLDGCGRKEKEARGRAMPRGVTALTMATSLAHQDKRGVAVVQRLLTMGANINARDQRGMGVFHHLPMPEDTPQSDQFRRGLVTLLLKHGGDIDMADHDGATALVHSILAGDIKLALLLTEFGGKLDGRDNRYNKTDAGQGTCFRPGATVLHHLVSTPWVTADSHKFLEILQARHPGCWQWTNALGETPEQMLRRAIAGGEEVEPFWLACAEQRRFDGDTAPILSGRRPGPRL